MADADIPTMTVRPNPKQEGDGGNSPAGKLSYGDMVQKWKDRGYSDAGARGMADNMTRESSGDPTAIGPGGHAIGLFQHEGDRRTKLEAFAKKRGTSPTDPDTQIEFADQELKTDYPSLRDKLRNTTSRAEAEDSFKRLFERPKSVLWAERPPKTETDGFRFSPYAMREHADRPNTDVVMMAPDDFLDLSSVLGGKPFANAAGRSLLASADKGEPIEAIPTLDVDVDGNTGKVTDQDGRQRALLAKHAGVDAIPVAINKTGEGDPTELVGAQGKILPNTFPKIEAPKPQKPQPRSVAQTIGDAIIPRAEAGEPPQEENRFAKYLPQAESQPANAGNAGENRFAKYVPEQEPEPDNAIVSAGKGAAAGIGREVTGLGQIAGKTMQALGAPDAGKALYDASSRGNQAIDKYMAPDEKAHPWATGIGDFAGGMLLPGVGAEMMAGKIGGKIIGNALKAGIAGGINAGLEPVRSDKDFWRDKAVNTITGTVAGLAAGKAGDMLGNAAAGKLADPVKKLMSEGVEMTPGQMAGGAAKRLEDTMASVPVLGNQVRAAQRRSIETFNRAAINRALENIGTKLPDGVDSGFKAINWAEKQFQDAYNLVIPNMTGIRDPTFVRNLNSVVNDAVSKKLPPDQVAELRHTIQTEILDKFNANGRITGEQAQDIGTRLDEIIKPLKVGNVYQQQQARFLRDADKALDDMMATHNATMQAAKDRIDKGYAKFKTIQLATKDTNAHPDGTFTPAQLADAVFKRDRSKDKAAYHRGDAQMQDLANAGREVLPQKVSDSGTPERLALMGALAGTAKFVDPHTAIGLGLASSAYTKPVGRLTQAIMNRLAQQPGPTRNAFAGLLRAAGPAGAAGAGSLAANQIPTMTVHPGDQ